VLGNPRTCCQSLSVRQNSHILGRVGWGPIILSCFFFFVLWSRNTWRKPVSSLPSVFYIPLKRVFLQTGSALFVDIKHGRFTCDGTQKIMEIFSLTPSSCLFFLPLKGKNKIQRKSTSYLYGKTMKQTPIQLSINLNFPLLMEKWWSTEARWFLLHPPCVAHPPPPPHLVFQKSMTAPICIIELPCGARLRRKGFYACLAWLAWRMHYALSTPANTHVYMQMHRSQLTTQLPYVQFPRSTALGIWRPQQAIRSSQGNPHIFSHTLKINVLEHN